jgi:hypothetical protein
MATFTLLPDPTTNKTPRESRGWFFWTVIAVLPFVPAVAYFQHGNPVAIIAILVYFCGLALAMRSRLIACTLIGAILDTLMPSSFCVLGAQVDLIWIWFGIAAGIVFDLVLWFRSQEVYPFRDLRIVPSRKTRPKNLTGGQACRPNWHSFGQ